MEENVSILIIEDEALVAHDIARLVKKLGYDVAALKHNSNDALNYLSIHRPDLILCDINLKGDLDGIDIAEKVNSSSETPIIYITAYSDKATLERAKKTLPYGYIVKPFTIRDLSSAIEIAMYKHSVELEKYEITKDKVNMIANSEISDREYEILQDITKGYTNFQISEHRHISVSTVKYHIGHLLGKLEAKNRADALHKIIALITN